MQVVLEEITFNHDTDSATCDALNIRKNETEFVTTPEWKRTISTLPEHSLAAYAIKEIGKNVITIKARFTRDDLTVTSVEIQAVNVAGDEASLPAHSDQVIPSTVLPPRPAHSDVLGWVPPQQITFSADGELLKLQDSKVSQAGVGTDVIHWQWQYRRDKNGDWQNIGETTHQIHTVLSLPQCPWQQQPYEPDNTQLPWADVLDYACHWAYGTHHANDAAIKLTYSFRELEKVFHIVYDFSAFYSNPDFDCTSFLGLLKGGLGKGRKLNCSDCATVVSTFANIVGCSLSQSCMSGKSISFITNPIRLFGQTCWQPVEFVAHEVAWLGECSINDNLFDGAIELDGDNYPARPPQRPLLPRNIPFGGLRDRQYLFRFVSPADAGGVQPKPKATRQRRSIRPNPQGAIRPLSPELLELIKAHYRHSDWPPVNPSSRVLSGEELLQSKFAEKSNFLDLVILVGPDLVRTLNHPPTIQMVVGSTLGQEIRLDIYVCDSAALARNCLLQQLGRFDSPSLRRTDIGVGEIAFVETETGSTLFVRSNLVTLVRNARTAAVSLANFAQRLDVFFLELLAQF